MVGTINGSRINAFACTKPSGRLRAVLLRRNLEPRICVSARMKASFLALVAAALMTFAGSGVAVAQQTPVPAPTAPSSLPQDAVNAAGNLIKGAFGWNDNESIGAVTFYRGYQMQVRQQLNRYRDIHLHKGTVINPRGWTIQPGETIDIRGRGNPDGSLEADIITVLNR